MSSDANKISKSAAGYTNKGKPAEHCSICKNFSRETCKIVSGHVDPGGWCRYFDASSR